MESSFISSAFFDWMNDEEHKFWLRVKGLHIKNGETKVCIYDDDPENDWVIKIGFLRKTEPYFVDFGADQDYCKIEADIYNDAIERTCGWFLAETVFCGRVDDVAVFIQEKAIMAPEDFESHMDNYVSDYDEEEMDDASFEFIRELFTEKEAERLIGFIKRHHINDLHTGNWGYSVRNGRVMMIDYTGLRGD